MRIRTYGTYGPAVIVLHGGPGAPGYMAPVARGLADSFRVLEPWQRPSGGEPLTVARHVADLHELVESHCAGARPALVGSSWGAMLALVYAAAHSDRTGPLVLIGCGTFDRAARRRMQAMLDERLNYGLRQRLERLPEDYPDPDQRLEIMGKLILPLYSYDLVTTDQEIEAHDARARQETWADMVRLQDEGVYPAAFAAIDAPVLMLHGAADPHPGPMIRDSLEPHLPQLEYHEWQRCGHYPWLEKTVRNEFFAVLRTWLAAHLTKPRPEADQPSH
jgi:pimeloyl-ACP methyl ester carboxylesterase